MLKASVEEQPPPYSSIYLIGNRIGTESNSTSAPNPSPISYGQLFQTNNETNADFFSNIRQNLNEIRARNNSTPITNDERQDSKTLADKLHKTFDKHYLIRHAQIIGFTSVLLIILQATQRVEFVSNGVKVGIVNAISFMFSILTSNFKFKITFFYFK